MDAFLAFFSDVPTWFRVTLLMGGLIFFWILEGIFPLFSNRYPKYQHAGINLFFTGTTAIVNMGLAFCIVMLSDFVTAKQFGFIYWLSMPLWLEVIVAVMLLDLIGAYFVHWVEHKVKWMWKFHLIHHTDTNIDVTSGLRHHPGESVFRLSFTLLATLVVGAPMAYVMIYQSLSALFTHITHANVKLPFGLDRVTSYVFVSPFMHKVHHHYQLPYTNTNYGNIFSIWDRVFGTFAQVNSEKEITYGVDTHMDPKENANLGNLLAIPFQEYRPPLTDKMGNKL